MKKFLQNYAILWVVLLTLIVLGLSMLFLWEFVRENVIQPIYAFAILAAYGINSIPQPVYLAFLVLAAAVIAISALNKAFGKERFPDAPTAGQYSVDIVSRYDDWRTQCENLHLTPFAHEEFARAMRNLLLELLAYQEHRSPFEIEALLQQEALDLPKEVQHLLLHRQLSTPVKRRNWFQRKWQQLLRLIHQQPTSPPAAVMNEAEAIITFLEQRLEIYHHD